MLRMGKTHFLLLWMALFLGGLANAQSLDPNIEWKRMEEPHAVWIYDSRHKDLVLQYSKNFKRVFPQLQKMFGEVPETTTFVITDHTDLPNGSATVFPYPLVTIFPVIPIPTSPIGETDDSLFEILAHEYTHILNIYPVHGGMRALNWVFGSLIRPNSMLPRWYVEGLAVFTETYYTPRGGRLRSQNFEGLVRAMSLNPAWNEFSIDRLNDFHPDWFGGRRAYLLGGALMHELAATHGIEKVGELNERYSRRVPFLINGPLEDETDRTYSLLLKDSYTQLQNRARRQTEQIQTRPTTKGTLLPAQGNNSFRPRFSPDGQYLAYVSGDQIMPSTVLLVKREKEKPLAETAPQQIASGMGIEHLSWAQDSKTLVYNKIETHKRFYIFSDLYMYDLISGKTRRLTHGARAGDMVFSEDNKTLFFVQNTPGSKKISKMDLESLEIQPLFVPPRFGSNLFGLTVQGDQLLFIEQNNEIRQLKTVSVTTPNAQAAVLTDKIRPTNMRNTKEGILFTSMQSGVDNLYFAKKIDGSTTADQVVAVTNSKTRVFDGDIDPQDQALYFSEQRENGVFLYSTPASDWKALQGAPKVEPLLSLLQAENPPEVVAVKPGTELPESKEEEYKPWNYLLPRYWMPYAYVVDGGMGFQASTGSMDPVGRHGYSALLEWDTLTEKTGASLAYSNRTTPVEITATASQVYRYIYSTATALKDNSYSLGGSFNLPFIWRQWLLGVTWRHSETEFSNYTAERSGPGVVLSYGSTYQRGYQISPETGGGFSLAHQTYVTSLGNIGYNKTNLNFRQYFSRGLPERHALYAQLNGTYAGDLDDPNFFTNTIGGNFFSNLLIPPFLVRGYPSGGILGNNMMAVNLEYRFPLLYPYRGVGTVPFFLKQVHGAVVADTTTLDGFSRNFLLDRFQRESFGHRWFTGYGAEIHFDCTIGYYVPITFTLGVYRGQNRAATNEEYSTFFSFRL